MIELLDVIRLRPPYDAPHVTRAADRADVPVTNTGVLRLLRRPLDQRTTTSLTTELARYCDKYLDMAKHTHMILAMAKADAGADPVDMTEVRADQDAYLNSLHSYMRDSEQANLRRQIKAAVNR